VQAQVPLLLVDVDGVISLFGFDHTSPPAGFPVSVDGIPHWLSEGAGARLQRLARTFECVWCTGWEDRAEDHLPYFLGLPGGWDHVRIERSKLRAVCAFAGTERPLAWIDDDHNADCRAWAAARPGRTLLVTTDAAVGLTDEHVAELEAWAAVREDPAP
jgi:hypothetical protein